MTYYVIMMQNTNGGWFELSGSPVRYLSEAKRIARRRALKNSKGLVLRKLDIQIFKRTDETIEGWTQ